MDEKPKKTEFLSELDNAVGNFIDGSFKNVICISHNDADGISSLHLIQNLLYKMKIDFDYFIYNRSVSWRAYLEGILSNAQSEKDAFFLTDVGSNLAELIPIIKERKESFFILDHHEVDEVDVHSIELPENLHFLNPTIFNFDGLDHIAGATLTYMFAKRIKPSIIKQGWLTVIGIAGDSLKPMNKLKSFNREIYEELIDEEIVEEKEGIILFGGMHESIKNALKYSILPFNKGFGGQEDSIVKSFLDTLKINPNKKLVSLDHSEIQKIIENANTGEPGTYCLLPKKQGLLKFAFEHALLLNILCFKNISSALSIVQQRSITRYAKGLYYEYVTNLVRNLKNLVELPRSETEKAIFISVDGKIPPSNWSDTASFASVNEILDPLKILFLGGLEKKNQMIKLSIRCTRKYLKKNNGIGVNKIINKIKKELGGMGGGHKLAGGIRLSQPSFRRLKEKIDDFI